MIPRPDLGQRGGLQESLNRFGKIRTRLSQRITLTSYIELGTERNISISLPLDDSGELAFVFHSCLQKQYNCRVPITSQFARAIVPHERSARYLQSAPSLQ
jgi:hypothetical protein